MENGNSTEVWSPPAFNGKNDRDIIVTAAVSELIFLFLLNRKSLEVDLRT